MSTAPVIEEIVELPQAICVYCASSPGIDPAYHAASESLGMAMARQSRTLVYGGGDRGLMGALSTAVTTSGGQAIGVLPRAMVLAGGEGRGPVERRVEAVNSSNMKSIVVDSMHERKTLMAKIAGSGFIGLPGGFGTFEEILEAITWSQLGIHAKPVVLLNVNGFWNPLRDLVDNAIKESFILEKNRSLATFVDKPADASDDFDWGVAALQAIDDWSLPSAGGLFQWSTDKLKST